MTLELCSDLSAAEWITASDLPWERLVTFGPAGFPAYARLRLLPDPAYPGQAANDAVDDETPSEIAQLVAAVHVLSRHTRTPDDCYFCLWTGFGTGSRHDYRGDELQIEDLQTTRPAGPGRFAPLPYRPPDPHEPPKVVLPHGAVVPHRDYFLFRGTVSALGEWGAPEMSPDLIRSDTPPAFVWPADHAWCIANDVDPHWIGIAADAAAIEELTAHPRLDVVPADPRADQPTYY